MEMNFEIPEQFLSFDSVSDNNNNVNISVENHNNDIVAPQQMTLRRSSRARQPIDRYIAEPASGLLNKQSRR